MVYLLHILLYRVFQFNHDPPFTVDPIRYNKLHHMYIYEYARLLRWPQLVLLCFRTHFSLHCSPLPYRPPAGLFPVLPLLFFFSSVAPCNTLLRLHTRLYYYCYYHHWRDNESPTGIHAILHVYYLLRCRRANRCERVQVHFSSTQLKRTYIIVLIFTDGTQPPRTLSARQPW